MLTVVLSGRGTYQNSKGVVKVHSGMVGIVPPQDEGILSSDTLDPYVHYYCRFGGEYAVSIALSILRERGERFFPFPHIEGLAACIGDMGLHWSLDLPVRPGRRELLLFQALLTLTGAITEQPPDELTSDGLQHYLSEHVAEPTNLDAMATAFGVSRSTLCRGARRETGRSVQELHEEVRISWACALLKSTRFNITETALRTGYADPLYFSRVFKKRTGMPPLEWKKSQTSLLPMIP
jgi:AraC-like DNA-binding protein